MTATTSSILAGHGRCPQQGAPSLTVIVVSYETRDLTMRCLETLVSTTGALRPEIIVIDNASSDGSADAVAAAFPEVILIRSQANLGFAAANNLAARHARGAYLLLLNPDTETRPGAVEALLAFARTHPEAGICGGRTVFPDGSLNPASCWNRMTPRSLLFSAIGLSTAFPRSTFLNPEGIGGWPRDSVREVDIVVGCFLMIPRALWERLGGFDMRYFMYGEEADLCLRVRRLGYRPMITPEATIMHLVGASSGKKADKVVLLARAKATLIRDHWRPATVPAGLFFLWLWCATRWAASLALSVLPGTAQRRRRETWGTVWRRRGDWLAGYGSAGERSQAAGARAGPGALPERLT